MTTAITGVPGLQEWLPRQRWFPADDADEVTVQRVEPFAAGPVRGVIAVVATAHGRFHVPVGVRADLPAGLADAVIGTAAGEVHYDALADPELVTRLYDLVAQAGTTGAVAFRPELGVDLPERAGEVRPMGVEQSNTSLVVGGHSVLKVFRRVWPGENPDLALHRVLRDSLYVPRLLGSITLDGTDTLGLVESYVDGGIEGWEAARADLGHTLTGTPRELDLVGELGRLGVAVAAVHADLGRALGSAPADHEALADRFLTRLAETLEVAPTVRPYAAALRACLGDRVRTAAVGEVQRVHGDLHLGQVLRSNGRWVLLDFEGEPSAPLAERARPDSPLRDVAGMLRSLDYVAGHHRLTATYWSVEDERRSRHWVHDAQRAFLAGYASESGVDLAAAATVLRAYQLDKALYEVRYEAANRPDWLPVPLRAVRELVGGSS
ncbi:maltokinase [Saccharothrix saharensis]|uniref:Maltokinase n=1 Tax=Saccharothrix saharensis TaxID=571190 RepID=A0A543JAG1_9PSEU|nr:aminoglycoside phosphotransferase [Saccharothrix saharensis]TQM79825.1 maltokinase [Saccharothrix saharensis]